VCSSDLILLAVAGLRILLSLDAASAVWLGMAAACVWAGGFFGRFTLQVHGAIYLLLALLCLGTLRQAAAALLGTGELPWPVYAGTTAAALCYGLSVAGALRLLLAGVVALLLAAILATGLTHAYHGLLGVDAAHSYCAMFRTCVLALGALLTAWAGQRWRRVELSRLIYPLMLLAAYRLLTDDIHQERKAAAVVSLLVFGAVLMALSRWRTQGAGN
jgi:hypothetical protein